LEGTTSEKIELMNKKISFVIPCLNEKNTIQRLLSDVQKNANKLKIASYEIIIADNGSTDGTLKILGHHKATKVVNIPVRGYGAALHHGIMKAGGEYIVYADADLSYPFSNLSRFIKMIPENPDLVLGSRMKGKIKKDAMPPLHRYLGTPILSFLVRILYQIPTTDCNSGMRMVRKSFYKKLNMRNSGMEWASELLLKTALKKGKYIEVPILYQKDKRGRSPHLSTWPDGWRHLKAIFLLKPSSMYLPLLSFLVIGIFFYKRNFGITFLFLDLAVVLTLSLLTLELLKSIVEEKRSDISDFLKSFRLVPITGTLSILVGCLTLVVPDAFLGTKLFLINILGIVFMWIFLIETIKTHLVNKLS
jgi:glycosyltransferase involved in cell wall biosynthesis